MYVWFVKKLFVWNILNKQDLIYLNSVEWFQELLTQIVLVAHS